MPVLVGCDMCGMAKLKSPSAVKEHNFCSQPCRLKWFGGLNQQRKNKVTRFCEWCGSTFETYTCWVNRNEGRFCSAQCRDKWHGKHLKDNPDKYKHLHTQESIRKMARAKQNRRLDAQHIKSIHTALARKPNKAELQLKKILDAYFPGDWEYTGDGSLQIGNFVPDFTNRNSKKAIIELFGEHWHDGPVVWHYSELGRIMAYASLGFKCLVVWVGELQDKPSLVLKLKQFAGCIC